MSPVVMRWPDSWWHRRILGEDPEGPDRVLALLQGLGCNFHFFCGSPCTCVTDDVLLKLLRGLSRTHPVQKKNSSLLYAGMRFQSFYMQTILKNYYFLSLKLDRDQLESFTSMNHLL
jgi:hypothetical protein